MPERIYIIVELKNLNALNSVNLEMNAVIHISDLIQDLYRATIYCITKMVTFSVVS